MSDQLIVGFLDETSSITRTSPKLWSFRKPVLIKNTGIKRVNIIGFYTVTGNSVVDFKEDGKTESILSFMETIREYNPDKTILLILDNYKPHTIDETWEKARELDMILIHLPHYSPHLNPIEQLWRTMKNLLSQAFHKTKEEIKSNVQEIYQLLSTKKSYAKNWMKTYIKDY